MEAFVETENRALEGFVIAGRGLDRLPVAEVRRDRRRKRGSNQ